MSRPASPTRIKQFGQALRPLLPPLLSVALLVGLGYGFWRLGAHNPAAPAVKAKPDDQIGIRFYGVELRGKKQGTRFFSIFADQIEVTRDNRYVFFKGKNRPHGEFFNLKNWEAQLSSEFGENDENKARHLRWEAQRAEYDLQMENLTLSDRVKIISDAGDVIESDEIFWSKQEEALRSSKPTRMLTYKKSYFQSDKLEARTRLKEITLEGHVYLEMYAGPDQQLEVPGE